MTSIDFVNDNKAIVVKINEEIDHHICEKIKNKIDLAIDFKKANKLIFDFDGVNFMDSAGIGMIMGRYKNICKNGGKTAVVRLKPTIRKIFQMSGLFKIVNEYETAEIAIQRM